MVAIPTTFGEGGSGLSPRGNGVPGIATVLREVAGDLATLKGAAPAAYSAPSAPPSVTTAPPAVATSAPAVSTGAPGALPAFTDPPTAGEMATLRTAVNTLSTRLDEVLARLDGQISRDAEILARLDGQITRDDEALARLDATLTLLDAVAALAVNLRSLQSTRASATLLTTAP